MGSFGKFFLILTSCNQKYRVRNKKYLIFYSKRVWQLLENLAKEVWERFTRFGI